MKKILYKYNTYIIIHNTMNPIKIIHFGTSCCIDSIKHFPNVKQFVFVDTQPSSEFDKKNTFLYEYNQPNFITNLFKKLTDFDFELVEKCKLDDTYHKCLTWSQYFSSFVFGLPEYFYSTLFIFKNKKTNQYIKYYVSTDFLHNMNFNLFIDIKTADSLLISGYSPSASLLTYFNKPKNLICCSQIVNYFPDKINNKIESQALFSYLIKNTTDTISKYFDNFFIINNNSGEIKQCKSFNDLVYDL